MLVERNPVTGAVIGSAINVHKALGPGLLESTYQVCLRHELSKRGLRARTEVPLPVTYDGIRLDCGYRLDFVVEDQLIVEVKSIERMLPIHKAQMLTYLRLSGIHQGLLINFRVSVLTQGISSVVL